MRVSVESCNYQIKDKNGGVCIVVLLIKGSKQSDPFTMEVMDFQI